MSFIYRLVTTLSTGLPMLLIPLAWRQLSTRLPLHFMLNGQPDRFGSRYEWYGQLLGTLLLLVVVRALILRIARKTVNKGPARGPALYIITAGFVISFITLLILQGLYSQPLFAQWQPVLVVLMASSFIYFVVPFHNSLSTSDIQPSILNQPEPTRQPLHPLSRLIGIRVNLLAALFMIVVRPQDRWSIAVTANALALFFVTILWLIKQQQTN